MSGSGGKIYVLTRGGFGNVLFNFLISADLSKRYQMPLYLITQSDGKRVPISDYDIFQGYSFCSGNEVPPGTIRIGEPGHFYSPILTLNPNQSYLLDGYYQSYKYSESTFSTIKLELFNNIPEKYASMQKQMASLKGEKETILIHVRRGDYLNLPQYHPTQSDLYYQNSLNLITKDADLNKFKLLVFSDDLNFVQNWKLLKDWDFEIVDRSDVVETFILMSLADNFIISNSSYSLLAYYFRDRPEAKLCAPSKWFGPSGPRYKMDDLIDLSNNNVKILD